MERNLKTPRKYAYIVVFGAVWGGIEMSLGGIFHAVNLPFKGTILSAMGAFILISARLLAGGRWSSLYIGVIAAGIKLFSLGGLVLSPAIAILLESALAELIFSLVPPGFVSAWLTGAAIVCYTVFHRIFAFLIIYHSEISDLGAMLRKEASLATDVFKVSLTLLLLLFFALHFLVGSLSGFLAYLTNRKALKRMRGDAELS